MTTWTDPIYSGVNDLVCEWANSTPKKRLVALANRWEVDWDGPEPVMDEARRRVLAALGMDDRAVLIDLELW